MFGCPLSSLVSWGGGTYESLMDIFLDLFEKPGDFQVIDKLQMKL